MRCWFLFQLDDEEVKGNEEVEVRGLESCEGFAGIAYDQYLALGGYWGARRGWGG